MPDAPRTNLTARGRRRRALSGTLSLVAGGAVLWWLFPRDLPWTTGFLTFPPFLLGTLGVLQAAGRT